MHAEQVCAMSPTSASHTDHTTICVCVCVRLVHLRGENWLLSAVRCFSNCVRSDDTSMCLCVCVCELRSVPINFDAAYKM